MLILDILKLRLVGEGKKNNIATLVEDEGVIEADKELMQYITIFYKDLFGKSKVSKLI